MTTVQDIYRFIDQIAPFAIQESWDNSGMLVGHWKQPVSRVLMTLDITPEVIYEARKLGAELIVSHHPLLFQPAKQVTDGTQDLVRSAATPTGTVPRAASIMCWRSSAGWIIFRCWNRAAWAPRACPMVSAGSGPSLCRCR